MGAAGQGFLEWVRSHTGALDEESFETVATLREQGAPGNTWIWKEGKRREQSKDFAPYFPFDNGGTTPYFRQRSKADRHEVASFFEYVENGGTGEFEPYPLPSPERLQRLAED